MKERAKKVTSLSTSAANIVSVNGRPLPAKRKLISAAYEVMSRQGLEGSTIAEIIAVAGVGVGSFYNHFSSKEEVAEAVFAAATEEFGYSLEQTVRRVSNAAVATCYAYRRFIEKAENDKVWAAFLVQLEPSMQMFDRRMRKHARVGMLIGVSSGMFKVNDIEAGITAIHAMEVAMVRAMLEGTMSHEEAHQSSNLALKMFGVPANEADRLSKLSMADLRRELQRFTTTNENQ
jgi:AcrR family transcriptional regulator